MDADQRGEAPATSATTQSNASSVARGGQAGRDAAAGEAPSTLRQVRAACQMNMRYHAAREAWLDGTHRLFMFLVIASGTAAVLNVTDDPSVKLWAGAAAALLGALDLAFDLSNRARVHALMRRRFSEILQAAEQNPDQLGKSDAALAEVYGEEEPAYHALMANCHNATLLAVYDHQNEGVIVPWWHTILQQVWRFEGADYKKMRAG